MTDLVEQNVAETRKQSNLNSKAFYRFGQSKIIIAINSLRGLSGTAFNFLIFLIS